LDTVWRESERGLEYARKAKYRDMADIIVSQQRFIAAMQGRTATFSTFGDAWFNEAAFEAELTAERMPTMICWYWILKLRARFLSGDYVEAFTAAEKAKALLWATATNNHLLDYFYYTALTIAALYESGSTDDSVKWRELLGSHQEKLREWADNNPATFGDKEALVSAEIARVEGRDPDAMRLYEKAIQSARENGFVQNEGLAHETAARFYSERGVGTVAHAYLRSARHCYLRWGALGKVRQLDERYPSLLEESTLPIQTARTGATLEGLDVGTVVAASQAISGEIVLGRLIETLMRLALEHSGAERGLLILRQGEALQIEAEARIEQHTVEVTLRQDAVAPTQLAESVLRTAIRTRETVILDDASAENAFSADEYVRRKHLRSVLCLPLVKQAKLVGVLYLENNLASNAFTNARISVLRLLSTQAAISLENARLYAERQDTEESLLESQQRYERVALAAGAGFWDWDVAKDEFYVSPRLLEMAGFPAGTTISGREDFVRRTPFYPEDRDKWQQAVKELFASGGSRLAMEVRSVRDGKMVWSRLEGLCFRDAEGRVVRWTGSSTDITDRKIAQDELLRLERQLRQAQRLEAMGTLAGGIAHDFNNILGAIIGYGEMALRGAKKDTRLWRDLDAIMSAGERGRALVDRILAFSRSGVGERVPVHVEAVVREVLDQLTAKLPQSVTIAPPRLRAGRAAMLGDSTQVHQVVMNLTNNAVQAMPNGGVLRVTLETERFDVVRAATVGAIAPGDCIVLKVSDSGTGITPEVLERMFDPFFTTKEVGVGSGLGLSLVHGIVSNVGGAIDVATEVGRGSTFTIYLPRNGDVAESSVDQDRPLPRGDGQRVLVVDDEESLVRLARETLEELGYTPIAFTSSARALEAFGANPDDFDVILTDERMPVVSGSALIREVRRISPSIPIVLMSGYVAAAAALQARELGANDVLRKPLLARDLATSLAGVLHG
ncbi:MAG: hypothetical protein C5B56_08830, partial [Proteobacteria bacterium]